MPPKTRDEIEVIVRDFYNTLTQNPYYLQSDPDETDVYFKVSEADIQKAINSYEANQKTQEKAAKYMEQHTISQTLVSELCNENNIVPEIPFGRTANNAMDLSGTPEAKQKNIETLRKLANKDEFTKYIKQQIDLALNFDISIIANSNAIDAVDLCLDPATNAPIQATFIAAVDMIPIAIKLGIELTKEQKDLLLYNEMILGAALPKVSTAQKALSNDAFYCVSSEIPFVKELIDEPTKYGTNYDNDSYDFISMYYPDGADKKSFKERFPLFKLHELFAEHNLPKNSDLFEAVKDSKATGYISSDGKPSMAMFANGQLLVWEKSVSNSALKLTDSYDKAIEAENKIFDELNAANLTEGDPQFAKLVDTFNAMHDYHKQHKAPDTPTIFGKLSDLDFDLSNAVSEYIKSMKSENFNDASVKKKAEFCDTLKNFAYAEKECRQKHYNSLDFNVFAMELNTLLSDPQYDFNVWSATDSLRIKGFSLFQEKGRADIREETGYLMTKSSDNPNYENIIKNDAYELLHSQTVMRDLNSKSGYAIYQAAKTCNAVIYPKNGDASKMRMLYVDKNGKPRIAGPMDKMPVLGDTLSELDKLKKAGDERFKDFPDAVHFKFSDNLTDEEYDTYQRINDTRVKMAMPYFVENCKSFFPDAENPELLVSNALNYSYSRQNFAFSSYGEVDLTEAEKNDPEAVMDAKFKQSKVINDALSQRQFESEIIFDASMHPEYYATKELAAERQNLFRIKNSLVYDPDSPNAEEYSKIYESHHYITACAIEDSLIQGKLDTKDLSFTDARGNTIGEDPQAKPWAKIEGAASYIDAEQPLYCVNISTKKLYQVSLENGSIQLTEKPLQFNKEGDAKTRKNDFEDLKDLKDMLAETGTTRRDSDEYKEMVDTVNKAYELAKLCNTDKFGPKAVFARERMEAAKKKVADAADKYFTAKVDQSMNSRRSKRFAIAMTARHLADEDYREIKADPEGLMQEAIATKMCKVKMLQNGEVDRNQLHKETNALVNEPGFKALTSTQAYLDKLLKSDAGKLSQKFVQLQASEEAKAHQEEYENLVK